MGDLPKLIYDLALILALAGVVTVVFKRLRQPLVLGYIVAGFLSSPHMPYIPSVMDGETIEVWSQLGVIFLMFSIGLEFSFKKLFRGGPAPVFTSASVMGFMFLLGGAVGRFMGLSPTNYIFLGGMLCMSSTTIIYVAFNDLGLTNKRFAGKVISVLIIEDILGVVLMALLSGMAGGGGSDAGETLGVLLRLLFFLLLWFLVGIWFIPTLLRRWQPYINRETLVIMSVALCFTMVVIASRFGYSAALGAFVMGSILAETLEAERIEHSIQPLKDLFGAIFFVSVGMMVDPSLLIKYWPMILALVATVVLGQMFFGSLSFLFFGSSLPDAVRSGFSMVQIGEFSFIIAQMGVAAGLLDNYIYPVIVSVSIITTFLTPYSIRLANSLKFPVKKAEAHKSSPSSAIQPMTIRMAWHNLLQSYAAQTIAYGALAVAVIRFLFVSLLLLCRDVFGHWVGNAVCGVLTLMLLSLFLRPIVMRRSNSSEAVLIKNSDRFNRTCYYLLYALRFAIATAVVYYVFNFLSPYSWMLHIVASIFVVGFFNHSKMVKRGSVRMEQMFLYNLRRREEVMSHGSEQLSYAHKLKGSDLHVTQMELPADSQWQGKSLAQLHIGRRHAVHVTAIIRDHRRNNIPGGSTMLFPHDVLEVVGDDHGIELLRQRMQAEVATDKQPAEGLMSIQRVVVGEESSMRGMLIKNSGIRDTYRCMVIGIEKADGTLRNVSADYQINSGDIIWLAGEHANLANLQEMMG